MEKSRTDGGRAQSDFSTNDFRYGDGMQDVRLARASFDSFVCLFGKVERFGDDLDFLAVLGRKIAVQKILKSSINQFFFLHLFGLYMVFHNRQNVNLRFNGL